MPFDGVMVVGAGVFGAALFIGLRRVYVTWRCRRNGHRWHREGGEGWVCARCGAFNDWA